LIVEQRRADITCRRGSGTRSIPSDPGWTASPIYSGLICGRHSASLGVKVERVMTDNGSCYKSFAFQKACKRLSLKHIRTKPYTPKTNGKAERFIQTSLREWAYARASTLQISARCSGRCHPWPAWRGRRGHRAIGA
ncbi:MAG: family transposase, partial [Bradyrhizobium sp.]|nr:family transposase [Bradyrhizobium sp.]